MFTIPDVGPSRLYLDSIRFHLNPCNGEESKESLIFPQTVLALRGSGGIKGGLVKGSRHQAPHQTRKMLTKTLCVLSFFKRMVLALEF